MSIGNITKDNERNITIAAGTKFTDVLEKLDAVGAIERNIEYRKSRGLPLIYDVYTRQEDGSWKIKKRCRNKQIKMKFYEVTIWK